MKYAFVIDQRKCIGCHACTVACKAEHDVPIGVYRTDPWRAFALTLLFGNLIGNLSKYGSRCLECKGRDSDAGTRRKPVENICDPHLKQSARTTKRTPFSSKNLYRWAHCTLETQ